MSSLSLEGIEFLTSERGQAALARELPAEGLAALTALRGEGFSPAEAGWLLEQRELRARAERKLPAADVARMLFLKEALEQASAHEVATWRAQKLAGRRVLEVGAALGADSAALARAGCALVACELDPVRAALLRHNLAALGLSERVEVHPGDGLERAAGGGWDALYADPARRRGGKRVLGLEAMAPPLSALRERARADLLVKVAPGLDLSEVPRDLGLELVSLRGELKEALLTGGALRRPGPRAVLLGGDAPWELAPEGSEPPPRTADPGAFLFEPDPAVIRAGLVRALGQRLDAWQLDPRIAFLSGDAPSETPGARCWRVLRHGPYRRKEVSQWLRAEGAGRVIVKQRGTRQDAAALEKRLPRQAGGPLRWLFLARTDAGPLALLCADLED